MDRSSNLQCFISVMTKSSQTVIDAVDVICSARHVEIFSSSGEYLMTSDGLRVDEDIACERKAYMIPCSFEPSVSSCKLQVCNNVFDDLVQSCSFCSSTKQYILSGVSSYLGQTSGRLDRNTFGGN